jgi:hypothetical protein
MHAILVAAMIVLSPGTDACGLDPSVRGGYLISHPGSLEVAVAVAEARRQGLLATAVSDSLPNDVRLERMLADLGRLESQLAKGQVGGSNLTSAHFSLMLIGPALWSEYQVSPSGVRARFHTPGPEKGQAIVLTHHAVLKALLQGSLSLAQATNLGLIAFSGAESEPVQHLFEMGFSATS